MADTDLNASTLTVTITESLAVGHDNGSTDSLDFAQTYTHTFGSIINTSKRIIKLANTNLTEVATFGSDTANGAFVRADVRYIRVTNLDDTNPMNLSLQVAGAEGGTANMSTTVLVKAGESFMLGTVHDGIALADDTANIVTALTDLESLLVDPLSENIDVEVFIASV